MNFKNGLLTILFTTYFSMLSPAVIIGLREMENNTDQSYSIRPIPAFGFASCADTSYSLDAGATINFGEKHIWEELNSLDVLKKRAIIQDRIFPAHGTDDLDEAYELHAYGFSDKQNQYIGELGAYIVKHDPATEAPEAPKHLVIVFKDANGICHLISEHYLGLEYFGLEKSKRLALSYKLKIDKGNMLKFEESFNAHVEKNK